MSKNGNSSIGNSSNTKTIKFNLNRTVQVTKIFVRENQLLTKNELIFTMVDTDHSGRKESFSSYVLGTITKLYIHEWDTLSYGSLILEYEECLHTITFKSLCCDCGADLNQLKGQTNSSSTSNPIGDPSPKPISPLTTVSMEHTVPELLITAEVAEKYSIEERDRLLRERKLDLLVDLDQTLLHTTNSSNYYPYSPEVVAYQLTSQASQTFYTKLRPGVKEFLTNLFPYYQFHIVTFGERLYAHRMAKLIDPTKQYFYHRILSRNECFDSTKKTANLAALFPCGDSMVCIIDDREDVWNYARNLVHVKPYVWFKDVGDINDIHLPSPPIPSEQLIPPISEKEFEEQMENSEHLAEERVEMDSNALIERTTEEGYQIAIHRGEKRKHDYNPNDKDDEETNKKLKEQNEDNTEQINNIQNPVMNKPNIVVDNDNYLAQLEVILKRIHQEFYVKYDQWTQDKTRSMPDLKAILPDIRRQVLKNVSLCFSHLMPQGYPLEKHRATIIARAMGASVTQDLQIDDNGNCLTTHVVAGKQTIKVDRAAKYNIFVVTPEWLIDCYEQWERKAEGNYVLHATYDVRKSRLFTREAPRITYNDTSNGNDRLSTIKEKIDKPIQTGKKSSSTIAKPEKSNLKRPLTPDVPTATTTQTTDTTGETIDDEMEKNMKEYNFSMSVDQLSDMEKEVDDFCNEEDDDDDDDDDDDGTDDDSNDVATRPTKQQPTSASTAKTTTTTTTTISNETNDDNDEREYDSDSSTSQKLRDLILGKKVESDTDDESLTDDEAPHGWKNSQKSKQRES